MIKILFHIIFFSWLFTPHPLHVSMTNMELDQEKKELTASVKIFKDDFVNAINHAYKISMNMEEEKHWEIYQNYFSKYLNDHFKVKPGKNQDKQEWIIQKKSFNHEAVWFYLSMPAQNLQTGFQIENTLMYDLFNDQTNLIIFSSGKKQKAYKLKYDDKNIVIEW